MKSVDLLQYKNMDFRLNRLEMCRMGMKSFCGEVAFCTTYKCPPLSRCVHVKLLHSRARSADALASSRAMPLVSCDEYIYRRPC